MSDIFGLTTSTKSDAFGLGNRGALRHGFESFVARHPFYMVYVRKDVRYPHSECYLSDTKSPDTSCQECFGLGYKAQFEKHSCRRVLVPREVQSPIEEYGYLTKHRCIVFTPRYYYPKSKDLYLEVEWDVEPNKIETYGRAVKIVTAFQVDEIVAMSEDEVTFCAAKCDTYDFTKQQMQNWLLQLGSAWSPKRIV